MISLEEVTSICIFKFLDYKFYVNLRLIDSIPIKVFTLNTLHIYYSLFLSLQCIQSMNIVTLN